MAQENIDYDNLKRRGFLRQRQEGFFVLRTRMRSGVYTQEGLDKLSYISRKFGRGIIHATTRQGLEIPFIKFEDISKVEFELTASGIDAGTSGPRLRTTTVCPGTNWCKSGLINTFALAERIEGLGIQCGIELPHKFKIAISGCPNACTRPQSSEIGIHGQVDLSSQDKRIGYSVYLGGCGGRVSRPALRLDNVFTEEEVLGVVEKVVTFFNAKAKPRQRLGALIEEMGKESFLEAILKQ